MKNEFLIDSLKGIQGKTIAIVYIFEGETAVGFKHYHIWEGNVIAGWLNAIQAIHCHPFILDVRTFVEKAANNSLPSIDFVINLNCGSCELSSMGLVPSVCSFLGVPCIPCNTGSIITGEDKYIANLVALARGINTPKELVSTDKNGIYRPLNFGSSVGVQKGVCPGTYRDGTYQEFIPGYDITTPIVYSPISDSMELMPTVMILPQSKDPQWFYGEEENKNETGFYKQILPSFSLDLQEKYKDLVRAFSISTYCRIDARIKCQDKNQLQCLLAKPLQPDNVYFLEINPMPSIRNTNNDFLFSYQNLPDGSELKEIIDTMEQLWGNNTLNTFLLANSMVSMIRAKYKRQKGYSRA